MTEINHLKGIEWRFVETARLRMHVLTAGSPQNTPIVFLHGNTSGSTIWEEFMLEFSDEYYCVAPDLRGFGKTDEEKIIDGRRGIMDWVDDIVALAEAMELKPFHLVGHSLGGMVCWGVIGEHPQILRTATLIAPGPPMGFGGIHGKEGTPNNKNFTGSGGGIVVDKFAERIKEKDRTADDPLYSPRNAMNRLFWKNGFKAEREEDMLTAMLQIHTGGQQYPGDFVSSKYWPGVAPGKFGPVNALSPKYNQTVLDQLLRVKNKPGLLWMHGKDDQIISDESYSDPGFQGKMNVLDGWPGEEQFPPQPMLSQIDYALQQYRLKGGAVRTTFIEDCGHTPFIEKPSVAKKALLKHLIEQEN